jgi:hypothetical protein
MRASERLTCIDTTHTGDAHEYEREEDDRAHDSTRTMRWVKWEDRERMERIGRGRGEMSADAMRRTQTDDETDGDAETFVNCRRVCDGRSRSVVSRIASRRCEFTVATTRPFESRAHEHRFTHETKASQPLPHTKRHAHNNGERHGGNNDRYRLLVVMRARPRIVRVVR